MEQDQIQGFDHRSTIRDPKTGKVIKEQHFIRHDTKDLGTFFEGISGDRKGKFYLENGKEVSDPRIQAPRVTAKQEEKTDAFSYKK